MRVPDHLGQPPTPGRREHPSPRQAAQRAEAEPAAAQPEPVAVRTRPHQQVDQRPGGRPQADPAGGVPQRGGEGPEPGRQEERDPGASGDLVEDLPLVPRLAGRSEHRGGVLDVRPRAGGDDRERHVLALEPGRGGQDVVGVPVRLVDVQVQGDHEVQLLERVGQVGAVGAAEHRVAGQHEERAQLAGAGGADLLGHDRGRPGAHDVGEVADPAPLRVVRQLAGLLRDLLERHDRLPEQHPALPVEVAGEHRQGVDEDAGQRRVAAQARARAAVDRGPGCRGEVARQRAHRLGVDTGAG